MLEVDIACRLGGLEITAAFTASGGAVTALFGRSGAGKTSVVNMIAGMRRPDRGRIAVDGDVLFDGARGIDLPPERRRIGYVFQDARLFPHLSVRSNLRYGIRWARRDGRFAGFEQIVALLDLAALLDRWPASLSGGEKQRVAIGRALLVNPRLLLMDEPLASLDAGLKADILPYIERLRDELRLPILYVSHAMPEVVRLAAQLVVMDRGRMAAVGPVDVVLSDLGLRPLTGRYEAGSLIEATVEAQEADWLTRVRFAGGTLILPRIDAAPGRTLRLRVRARDVSLSLAPPADTTMLNVLPGTVAETADDGGPFVDVLVDVGVPLWARVTARAARSLGIVPGRAVYALVSAATFDRHSLGLSGGRSERVASDPTPDQEAER